MARGRRKASSFDTAAKRAELPAQHEPHWEPLQGSKGAYLGLFKPADWRDGAACTWRLRVRVSKRYRWQVLGVVADGGREAGGREGNQPILDYPAALKRAAEAALAIRAADRVSPGSRLALDDATAPLYLTRPALTYTVGDALADFKRYLQLEGKASAKMVDSEAASILPALGETPLSRLTLADLEQWRDALAATSAPGKRRRTVTDHEARRKRKVSVNRLISTLRAALNRAEPHLRRRGLDPGAASAWRDLKSFSKAGAGKQDVSEGRVRALTVDEQQRLLDACEPGPFRDLVLGALATGARYGELTKLEAAHYDPEAQRVTFPRSITKARKDRTVALNADGAALFERLTAGKTRGARIFLRPDGKAWSKSDQSRRMERAVLAAGIDPSPFPPTFHQLRDTYVKRLAEAGVSLSNVAKIVGHSSVTVTEKHYQHFFPGELDAAARMLPPLERPTANVSKIAGRRAKGPR